MARPVRAIGSVPVRLTPKEQIRNHAERLAYLGDASKIRAYLIDEYGDDGRVPNKAYLQDLVARRRQRTSRGGGRPA